MSARFVMGKEPRDDGSEPRRSPSLGGSWKTIKRIPKGGRPYATSLSFAFALTAIMTALVLVAVLGIVWEGQFMAYTRRNMQTIANSTAESISNLYARTGELSEDVVSAAEAASSLSPDIVVQVSDSEGNVLYDLFSTNPNEKKEKKHKKPKRPKLSDVMQDA